MNVFLLNPPYKKNFMRTARWAAVTISSSIWYPIYLAYCTGLLEKNGHKAKLVDGVADELTVEQVVDSAKKFHADIAVLYVSSMSLESDTAIGEKIKEATGCKLVFVGPWCSADPEAILAKSNAVDAVAVGEFDYTILDIANGVADEKINGLVWRKGKNILKNPLREPVTAQQLDEFPFVTDVYRRHLNVRNYFQAPQLYPYVDLFTGRGCAWGKCTFCLWPFTINKGAPYRMRDMASVIDEIIFVREKMPRVREIFIQDDTLPRWRARELASAVIESRIDVTWSCYSRVDMDYETLRLMKKSGCRAMHVGYESGCNAILKNICKGTTRELGERFTRDANRAGLQIHADFIFGLPGETPETLRKTIEWAKTLDVDSYQLVIPRPYPGTPFYEWLKKNDYLDDDGMPSYPELSYEDMCRWTRIGMKECYLTPKYAQRVLKRPAEWYRVARAALSVMPHMFSE